MFVAFCSAIVKQDLFREYSLNDAWEAPREAEGGPFVKMQVHDAQLRKPPERRLPRALPGT
jgi:hypothetical protein